MDAGARVIHVDVMDGHFVPPISIGALIVDALRDLVHDRGGVLDVHLMVERPERRVEEFAAAGRRLADRALGGHAARALRAQGGARGRAPRRAGPQPRHPAGGGGRPRGRDRPRALHDGQPGLGRPALHRELDRRRSPACASCSAPTCRSRWTAASTPPPPRPPAGRRHAVRGRLVDLRLGRPRGRLPRDRGGRQRGSPPPSSAGSVPFTRQRATDPAPLVTGMCTCGSRIPPSVSGTASARLG